MKKVIIMAVVSLMTSMAGMQATANTTNTVRFVISYPAGGPGDQVARLLQNKLEKELNKTVIVENRAGNGIACNQILNAPPTETVLMMTHPGFITNSIMNSDSACEYNKVKPVALLGSWPLMLVVSNKFGITDIKKWPAGVTYSTTGIGTGGHLIGGMLSANAKLDMRHVPYKGVPQYMPDLISGEVNASFTPAGSIVPYIRENKMLPVAIASARRNKELPNVPTLEELGYKNIDSPTWMHIFANTSESEDAVKVQTAMKNILSDKELTDKLNAIGLETVDASKTVPPKDFIKLEHAKFEKIISKVKITN
jgi:tripartite-type tricarboxylate transporter receptor subunit TctC